MKTRFDLERDILALWGVKEVVDNLIFRACDHAEILTEDQLANYLIMVSNLLELQGEKAFDTFKQYEQVDEYASEEAKEKRTIL
jgi:hypothetical protein